MTVRVTRFVAVVVAVACAGACGSDSNPDADAGTATVGATSVISDTTDSTTIATSTVAPSTSSAIADTTIAPTTTTIVFPPVPRVLLVGDSTLLAVEEYEVLHVIRGMDPVYEALAVALNERFSELGRDHPIPYSDDAG